MSSGKDIHRSGLPSKWSVICITNFLIGCLLGLLMRYKIVYPFKALSQDQTLHAHYNFMFAAWVGLTLFSCLVAFILPKEKSKKRVYSFAFYFVEGAAIGILICYFVWGFGFFSILFSALNILAALFFIYLIWKDSKTKEISPGICLFLRGALVMYLLSLVGIFMMMKYGIWGDGSPFERRAALYYYLHFQYNGWFTFSIFALLLHWLHTIRLPLPTKSIKIVFWLLAIGVIPGYGLSILAFYPYLWIEIPSIFSVITDFIAAIILLRIILKVYPHIHVKMSKIINALWAIATVSFFLKIVMQAATLIPSMASFAFSYRPLIIGFLHLTFLCFVSFFLIGYLLYFNKLQVKYSKFARYGLILFVVAVILSEIILFTQAFFAYINTYLFVLNFYLLWITVGMFVGLLLFVLVQYRRRGTSQNVTSSSET